MRSTFPPDDWRSHSPDFAGDARTADAVRGPMGHIGPAAIFPLGVPGDVRGVLTVGRHRGGLLFPQATADVIASEPPFVKAANAHVDATNVQPGVYTLHRQMSGDAALTLLLDTKLSLLSRLTLPEGLTVSATLAKIAASTHSHNRGPRPFGLGGSGGAPPGGNGRPYRSAAFGS